MSRNHLISTIVALTLPISMCLGTGCADLGWIDLRYQPNVDRKDTGETQLRRINSAEGWVDFFRDQIVARRQQSPFDRGVGVDDVVFDSPIALGEPVAGFPAGQAAPDVGSAGQADGGSGGNFSTTNVQELGVDEADVVKTDGRYLYMLVGGQLRIVEVYPVDRMAEMAAVELSDSGYSNSDLYLSGDQVIAITQPAAIFIDHPVFLDEPVTVDADRSEPTASTTALSPIEAIDQFGLYYAHQRTSVTIIDVSDRSLPTITAQWQFDGYQVDSRMVDGALHLILNQSPYIPHEFDPDDITIDDIAKYIPTYEVVFADGSADSGMLVMWDDFYHPVDRDGYNITTVLTLDTTTVAREFTSLAIMADPGTVYASTQALYLTDPEFDYFGDFRETLDIHKFALRPDGVEYVASGAVEGRLLNQFSLGEHRDHLRVATTTDPSWAWDEQTSKNHIFVLAQRGDSLEVVGSLKDLAPGEQIYSARFLGERGFLVTFRRIDPLFTIDLSNPANPRVAGKLKIPGFSEYIHPLGDDHLLTLGRAADDDGVTLGLQLSIFDVGNFSDPQLVASKQIGGLGTYSEAEHNHKAFTFDAERNLLAIPVDLYANWWEYEFSGVQVYHISPQEGITLRGQISTQPDAAVDYPSYWGWTRGLFIEDSIYAVTEVGVDAALTTSPSNVINSIELQGSSNIGGGGIIGVVVDPAVDVGIDAPVDEQTGGVSGGGDAAP